jgi:hypothetical protein
MVVPLFPDVHHAGIGFAGMKINHFIMYTLVQVRSRRAYSTLLKIINEIIFTQTFEIFGSFALWRVSSQRWWMNGRVCCVDAKRFSSL